MSKNPENRDDGVSHPTILEAVRIVAEKIADGRVSLKAQIREAFDEIVKLQERDISLAQICRGINEAGATISQSHLMVIMTRIREERGIKRRHKKAVEAPAIANNTTVTKPASTGSTTVRKDSFERNPGRDERDLF